MIRLHARILDVSAVIADRLERTSVIFDVDRNAGARIDGGRPVPMIHLVAATNEVSLWIARKMMILSAASPRTCAGRFESTGTRSHCL